MPRPEVVPFRLTANFLDAFGPTGKWVRELNKYFCSTNFKLFIYCCVLFTSYFAHFIPGADGVYAESLKLTMGTLRDNRDTLLSVLEPFIRDPIIDWKRSRNSQSPKKSSATTRSGLNVTQGQDRQTREAIQSIRVIDERLRGIYNLRNPNLKKVKRTDGGSVADEKDELTLPLSVEGQVHKMIAEATSSENLLQVRVDVYVLLCTRAFSSLEKMM